MLSAAGQVGPDTIADTIEAAKDAVARYIEEAKAIRGPRKAQRIRSDLVAELERSQRALEMVEHGTSIMVNVRRGPRELEAQTSIKRGYLNLIHAREAIRPRRRGPGAGAVGTVETAGSGAGTLDRRRGSTPRARASDHTI